MALLANEHDTDSWSAHAQGSLWENRGVLRRTNKTPSLVGGMKGYRFWTQKGSAREGGWLRSVFNIARELPARCVP